MILYLDTSALVRLYVAEEGDEAVRSAVRDAAAVVTHLVTYAEMRAAVARMSREGRLAPAEQATVRAAFERDWERLLVVRPTEATVRRAGDLADRFALRGYDSVQLAAAEEVLGQCGPGVDLAFASGDRRLAEAAAALGMVIPPGVTP